MTSAAQSTLSLGPYRLIGQIGEGGMGVVYLAQGPDDRRVAVKILRPSVVGDANGRARLAREVTSLRRVRSPRIAEVYDADPWGQTPYVVMRYVPGPSLREVVEQRGVLTGPALGRLALGLAQALVVVHRADVLHRDVKPSNVLIEEGDPVLIDFGLAQLSDDMTLTQTGWLLGTPGYLAPEILYGDGPTPAADVHSWAATVTYAATGRGPYGSGPAMAVMDRARRGESDLSGLPSMVGDIVAAALRTDPGNRPTAQQLVEWLEARLAAAPAPVVVTSGGDAETSLAPVRRSLPSDWTAPIALPDEAISPLPLPTAVTYPAVSPSLAPAPPAGPEAPARVERLGVRGVLFWGAVLVLVVAGTIAAPIISLAWVVGVGWGVRALSSGASTLASWRSARGARRGDEVRCALLIPWFLVRTLPASALAGCSAAVVGGVFVSLARFGPDVVETPALALGGLAAGLCLWCGPRSVDVRRGGRLVAENLPRSRLAVAVLGVLLIGVASGLLAAHQIVGPSYRPFG